ncbi:MAG: 2-keto-4-pentenoate hydratase [Burkholderiales bacterium]
MDDSRIRQAAQFLLDEHAARHRFRPLPAHCAPASVEEAYAVQDAFVALKSGSRGRRIGWKIALTTPQMQAMVGLDTPIAGAMHEFQVLRSPARTSAAGHVRLIVEFEICMQLGSDLPPRQQPYTAKEAGSAVAAVMPALELADDRDADYAVLAAHGLDLIADNARNEGAVLGTPVQAWQAIDLATLRGVASINGSVVGEGSGTDAMGHPLNVVAWIANHLATRGQVLAAGDVVITGSLVTSKFPRAGDRISFDAGALGTVALDVGR